ncbi:hypothetical protein J437_LFUL012856 [Ladona fulva]|uniref:Uncharacterized protein n=1 Tax=Ladona fulva TaxID=123851 RepID=A0A8K0KEY1_LADFU|nr:hypothetical protein J437_LFUL012856 [Ladona fulva]
MEGAPPPLPFTTLAQGILRGPEQARSKDFYFIKSSMATRQPVVVRVVKRGDSYGGEGGINCCCCRCCSCLYFDVLKKSPGKYKLIQAELLFNGLACILYLASGGYLAFSVSLFLWPMYLAQPFFQAYPALTACYVMSFLASIAHGMDAYSSYKLYRGR